MYYNDMTCSPSLVAPPSSKLSKCQVPMGIAYSIAHDTAFILGPYTYSQVVGGNSFCSYSYQQSYYIAINAYVLYISQVVGRSFLVGDNIYPVDPSTYSPEYDMIYPDDPAENPLHPVRLSGDFYKSQSNVPSQEPASSSDFSTSYESSSIVGSSTTSNESSVDESTSTIDILVTSSEVEIESSHSQAHTKCPTATSAVYSSISKCVKKI
ncbi:hypothetical protein GGH96_005428 [Coemansia sp. RSA 1972]|nr:hypothetical protein GGH96_005428 [Coemansia sp. RSA 1972]